MQDTKGIVRLFKIFFVSYSRTRASYIRAFAPNMEISAKKFGPEMAVSPFFFFFQIVPYSTISLHRKYIFNSISVFLNCVKLNFISEIIFGPPDRDIIISMCKPCTRISEIAPSHSYPRNKRELD